MPYATRKSHLYVCKETATYGTAASGATGTMLGADYGPLSGIVTATMGAQANTPGVLLPMLGPSQLEPMQEKHVSPAQVGRRFEDVAMVQGRREGGGSVAVEVMPDTFGLLLYLACGADVVTPTGSSTCAGTNSANATTLNVATGLPALTSGQRIFILDGANSEYVSVNGDQAANTLAVPITGGGGTGGGLKFTHAVSTAVQVGPWTHVITVSNPVGMQVEDNYGGHASSLLYQGGLIDQIDFEAAIENPTDAVKATLKIASKAPSATLVAASPAGSLPVEEVPIAAGNNPTFTITGGTDATIYVANFKASLVNNAQLAKAGAGPDPYGAIGAGFSLRGSMDTAFEDYGIYQDFMNNLIWSPATFLWTWPQQLMPAGGTGLKQAATVQLQVQRFAIEKLGKPTDKGGLLHLPIGSWRAMDYSDFGAPMTWTVRNGVAQY